MKRWQALGWGAVWAGGALLLGYGATTHWSAIAANWQPESPRSPTPSQSASVPNPDTLISQRPRPTTMNPKLVSANTQFGFKLFAAIAEQQPQRNVFISPSSVAIALAMVYNGANGKTQQEMATVLALRGMDIATLNQANADLQAWLENPDPQIKLAIANSLWANQEVAFQPDFIQRNQRFYQAELTRLNFTDPGAAATINRWVGQKTQGKITEIVDRLDADDVMVLINAIYFKGNWSRQFDPKQTTMAPFYPVNGDRKDHPFMAQSGEYRYLDHAQFQGVMLPYGEQRRMSMVILLPKPNSSLAQLQRQLTATNWETWMAQFRNRQGSIQVPRFKLAYETELTRILAQLGMPTAFSRQADFSGMSTVRTHIDAVKHKTFVDVNEEGTEAAAVTSIGIRATSIAPMDEPFRMTVDRPFFCAIRDNQTGSVLFMGAITNPEV